MIITFSALRNVQSKVTKSSSSSRPNLSETIFILLKALSSKLWSLTKNSTVRPPAPTKQPKWLIELVVKPAAVSKSCAPIGSNDSGPSLRTHSWHSQ